MNIMEHKLYCEWLEGLKAGDEVVIEEKGYRAAPTFASVFRTTKTQIIAVASHGGRERRFRISNGREVGTSFGPKLAPVTDESRAKVLAAQNRSRFSSLTYRTDKITDGEIAAMLEAYDRVHVAAEGEKS